MSETQLTFSPAATALAERLLPQAQEILARYPEGRQRSALLPLLHLVQAVEGYVSPAGVAFCAEVLDINKAQVSAVATFYTMYKRRPTGDFLVSVCTNTMCNVLGGQEVYDALTEHLGVGHDETTADRTITLEHAECLAACDYGPVMTVNYEFFDRVDRDTAVGLVDRLRAGERPMPTRGARLCTLKEMAVQLAGFAEPRAEVVGDGPAGAPTLRGVMLAQEHGISVAGYDPDTPIASKDGESASAAGGGVAGRVAAAAKKVAQTVKSAATGTRQGERTEARDSGGGDVKDPATRAGEARNPDAATPAPDDEATKVPSGGPPPAAPDAQAAQAAGAAANRQAGDAKSAGDEGVQAQAQNLRDAAADGTKKGDLATEKEAGQ